MTAGPSVQMPSMMELIFLQILCHNSLSRSRTSKRSTIEIPSAAKSSDVNNCRIRRTPTKPSRDNVATLSARAFGTTFQLTCSLSPHSDPFFSTRVPGQRRRTHGPGKRKRRCFRHIVRNLLLLVKQRRAPPASVEFANKNFSLRAGRPYYPRSAFRRGVSNHSPIQLPQTYYLLYFTTFLQKIPPPITPSLQPFPSYLFHTLTNYLFNVFEFKKHTVFILS